MGPKTRTEGLLLVLLTRRALALRDMTYKGVGLYRANMSHFSRNAVSKPAFLILVLVVHVMSCVYLLVMCVLTCQGFGRVNLQNMGVDVDTSSLPYQGSSRHVEGQDGEPC